MAADGPLRLTLVAISGRFLSFKEKLTLESYAHFKELIFPSVTTHPLSPSQYNQSFLLCRRPSYLQFLLMFSTCFEFRPSA